MALLRMCRHCGVVKACRPRGLCSVHYDTVRNLYPSTSKYGRRGVGHHDAELAPFPTQAEPGSAAKKTVMEQRVMMGFEPHHPGDATINRGAALATALWNPLDWRTA